MKIDIPDTAIAWLRHGERGISSEAIFAHLTGVPVGNMGMSPPYDASDLRRCRLLLAAVPEFAARIDEMAQVSPQWARLVERWDEVCALMDAEAGTGTTRKTYALIQSLLYGKATP